MKAFLPSVLILAAILAAAVLNCGVIARRADCWSGEIQQAEALAREGDWQGARSALKRARRSWNVSRTYLRITIRHEELDNAEAIYCRAAVSADAEELSDFLSETAELRNQLHLLSETEQFTIGNVF